MKKVLITGINSFTGNYVRDLLISAGFEVFGYCRKTSNMEKNTFEGDLLDPKRLAFALKESNPNYIIHLAAISFVEHGTKTEIYNSNLMGTINLLESIKNYAFNVEQIVIASSANIYGNVKSGAISESQPLAPLNEYAASKAAMEYAIHPYFNYLPITLVRPFNYTGVGQSENFLIPKIVKHYSHRIKDLELGNIDVSRDFSDVRDIASYYVQMLGKKSAIGKTFNFCSGESISLSSVLHHLSKISNFEPIIHKNENFVRKNDVKSLWGDNSKLNATLGSKRKFNFFDTLSWMYRHGEAEHSKSLNTTSYS